MINLNDALKQDPTAIKELEEAEKRYLIAYQKIHYTHFSSTQLNQIFRLGGFDKWGDPVFFVFGINHSYQSNNMERLYLLIIRWFEQQFRNLNKDQNRSIKFSLIYFNNQCNSYLQYFAFRRIYRSLPKKYLENLKKIIVVNPGLTVQALEWMVLGTINKYLRSLTIYAQTIGELEKNGILLSKQSINIIPQSMRNSQSVQQKKKLGVWNNMCKSHVDDSQYEARKKPRIFSKEAAQSDTNIKYKNTIKNPIQLMKKKLTDYELSDIQVPIILKLLITYLQMRPQALKQQGIFRRSVSIDDQQQAIIQIYKKNYNFLQNIDNPHLVANLIKKFMVNLVQPLITYSIYNKFIYNVSEGNVDLKYVKSIINQLPKLNYVTLQYVLSFFKDQVVTKNTSNKMTNYNISVVLCPCLFRSQTVSMNDFVYGKKLVTILENIIINFDFIFGTKKEQQETFRMSNIFVQQQFQKTLLSNQTNIQQKIAHQKSNEHVIKYPLLVQPPKLKNHISVDFEGARPSLTLKQLQLSPREKVSNSHDSLCLSESSRNSQANFKLI